MQISLAWLKNYIRITDNPETLAQQLTFAGIEVEAISTYGDISDSVITALVVDCQSIPDSDHLKVCQVNTGFEILQVVCGAPNCEKGILAALALPGTKIGEMTIRNTTIRGVASSGMLCSEKELGLSDDHSGIIILPADTPIGIPLSQYLLLPDNIMELEITPNRPDLLGYTGIATDLAALTGNHLVNAHTANTDTLESTNNPVSDYLNLDNQEPVMCPRYTARVFRNVKVQPSPLWLRQRLLRSGLRPINNIVDITNYVMLEMGHPLHAFDYDKLEKTQAQAIIKIRRAREGETFPALDGNLYTLSNHDLVIADAERAIAIAGVIGGTNSHITDDTVSVVLEAANFDHSSIRRTSYQHKIQTDSAYRFERHLADETAALASARAAELIVQLSGATLCLGMLDSWPQPAPEKIVPFRPERFTQVIGICLSKEKIIQYLTQLGLRQVSGNSLPKSALHDYETLYFSIPPKRIDLEREIDLIEEVIRLHGMDKVPQKTKPALIMDRHAYQVKRALTDYLISYGFQEVVNLSFTDPGLITRFNLPQDDNRMRQIELLNPQNSNLSVMRSSLLPQLLQNALYNLNREEKQLRLFELNKVFLENGKVPKHEPLRLSLLWSGQAGNLHWQAKPDEYSLYHLKGVIEGLVQSLGLVDYSFDRSNATYLIQQESLSMEVSGKTVGEFGKLSPAIAEQFGIDTVELKQDIWLADIDLIAVIDLSRNVHPEYKPIPRYPSVERDISFLISQDVPYSDIAGSILNTAAASIKDLQLIDEYRGKQVPAGYRSLTLRIIFNHPEKTLTDDEVEANIVSIIDKLKSLWDIQMR